MPSPMLNVPMQVLSVGARYRIVVLGCRRQIATAVHSISGKIANAQVGSTISNAIPGIITYPSIFIAPSLVRPAPTPVPVL